ncbi:MAG TPA: glycosyltransferase [Gemmatimonadota bacterium]|jgi:GT2 family glycosyltransferase
MSAPAGSREANGAPLAVSLVVCTRDRPEMLAETLRSILDGDAVPAELIVVDQSRRSSRPSGLPARGCDVRWLTIDGVGLSRANNAGAAAARHDRLVFTHDDVRVAPGWLGALTGALQRAGERTVVTGRILAGEPEVAGGYAPTLRVQVEPAVYEGRIGYDVLKPLNMAMHRSTLAAVGGFDERLGPGTPFPGAEDSDLGFRLLEAGYRIVYVPEAVLHHRAWRTGREYLPLRWRYGIAQGAFYAKHLRRSDLHVLKRAARDVQWRASQFPRRLRREGLRALGDPVFVVGNVVGAARWWWREAGPGRSLR